MNLEYASIILSEEEPKANVYQEAIAAVIGETSRLPSDLRISGSTDPSEVREQLEAMISTNGPSDVALTRGVDYLTDKPRNIDAQEARALIIQVFNAVIAARLAVAITIQDQNLSVWFERALAAWDPGVIPEVKPVTASTGKNAGQSLSEVWGQNLSELFNSLSTLTPALTELWDFTHYLLCEEPMRSEASVLPMGSEAAVPAKRQVNLKVLRDEGTEGFVDHLTLEYLEQGCGFVRDPRTLFLPCDREFRKVFTTVAKFASAMPGFTLFGNEHRWGGGAIRWRLTCPGSPLEAGTGGSLGGAVSMGTLLLLAEETGEPDISITATVTPVSSNLALGKVGEMGSIRRKFDAAIREGITTVLLAENQAEFGKPLFKIGLSSKGLIRHWRQRSSSATKRAARSRSKTVHQRSAVIRLFDHDVEDGMTMGKNQVSLYQACPLMQEIPHVELPKDMPGRGDDRDEPFGSRGLGPTDHWAEREHNYKEVSLAPVSIDSVFKAKRASW